MNEKNKCVFRYNARYYLLGSPVSSRIDRPERVEPAIWPGGDDGVDLFQLILSSSRGANAASTGDDPKNCAQDVRDGPKRDAKRRGSHVHEGVFHAQSRSEESNRHKPPRDDVIVRLGIAPESLLNLLREFLFLCG